MELMEVMNVSLCYDELEEIEALEEKSNAWAAGVAAGIITVAVVFAALT